MSQVWESGPEDRGELLVMLALADFADDRGRCWPSIATIAKRARMTTRSAQRILRKLQEVGAVTISTGTGRAGCNEYVLTPDARVTPDTVSPLTPVSPPPDARVTPPLTPVSPEPSLNHQEPSEIYTPAQLTLVAPPKKPPDLFSEFWDRYPKRVGKADAQKAYTKALKKITHDDLMFALSERLPALEAKDKQYRPNPATWLNQERWTDDIDASSDTGRSGPSRSRNAMVDAFAAVAAERTARNGGN